MLFIIYEVAFFPEFGVRLNIRTDNNKEVLCDSYIGFTR